VGSLSSTPGKKIQATPVISSLLSRRDISSSLIISLLPSFGKCSTSFSADYIVRATSKYTSSSTCMFLAEIPVKFVISLEAVYVCIFVAICNDAMEITRIVARTIKNTVKLNRNFNFIILSLSI
jgi:hypothetical protein